MHVTVSASARFGLTPDGRLWTSNASLTYPFWMRYLDVFDEVRLLVRARPSAGPPTAWREVTGPGVVALPLPDVGGVKGVVRHFRELRQGLRAAAAGAQAIQMRLPCAIGLALWRQLPPRRPYGVEVVGDPYDSFAPGAVRHPLRPLLRWYFCRQLRRQCREAAAAAYVTRDTLQRRYPAGPTTFATHYSSIDLRPDAFVAAPRPRRPREGALRLVFVAALAVLYKAPDVLLEAVALCTRRGTAVRLVLVGDGACRPELEARAARLGLREHVTFAGQLPDPNAVRARLDEADVFVLPSRTEGLPRAMLEAMARALPCVGSTVGGIPELLDPEDQVPRDDVAALAQKLIEVAADPDRLAQMSARNWQRSQAYAADLLRVKRVGLYQQLKEVTAAWRGTHPGPVPRGPDRAPVSPLQAR
jgi:glycosyltransferase involved in cell wall biosynthesis